ncbi:MULTISPECIES: radical SAM protein [Eubacteriales]|uniref:radical SAM protein n=1 Tax=Eubacteriales TaxID=186802 RepID=UPI0011062662|nr:MULTISPECIES: radical SAM protein [Eubacteriales]
MVEELQKITNCLVKKNRIPINGGIEILSACNFHCVHCYNGMEPVTYMTYEFANQLAEQLEKMGTMHVYLTGGEALLHPQFSEIYRNFRKRGITVSILTNASLIDKEYIKLFENFTPYNIDISLYGITNKTYETVTGMKDGFDKVRENIYMLSENKIPFSLKTVVLKENICELDEMITFANKVGKVLNVHTDIRPLNNGNQKSKEHQLSLDQIIEIERKTNKWKKYKEQYSERTEERRKRKEEDYLYFCELGKYTFFITYQGILYGCAKERRHGYDLHNISFEEGFDRMLKDIVLKKNSQMNKCAFCKYIKYCDYCPAQFELETGNSLDPPIDVCKLAYKRFLCFDKVI